MRRPRPTAALGASLALALVALLAVLIGSLAAHRAAPAGAGVDRAGAEPEGAGAPGPPPAAAGTAWDLPLPTGAEGWEEAAETVALDLRGLVLGRPAAGAYEEARAEAARRDLVLYPPDPARLRRMLLSASSSERVLALAALSARGEASDELVRLALRSARSWDDDVLRVLRAELVASLSPEQAARHEDDLLRVFEREPNPLVLAVALPALERLEAPRLRALVEAQLADASPEMVAVLAALARDRLPPEALRAVGISVFERGPGGP